MACDLMTSSHNSSIDWYQIATAHKSRFFFSFFLFYIFQLHTLLLTRLSDVQWSPDVFQSGCAWECKISESVASDIFVTPCENTAGKHLGKNHSWGVDVSVNLKELKHLRMRKEAPIHRDDGNYGNSTSTFESCWRSEQTPVLRSKHV